MTRKSPHNVAEILARFYQEHPDRWKRGILGNMETGCCLMGGVYEITNDIPEAVVFFQEFKRVTGWMIMDFNDKIARGVNDIIDALNKVEVNTR